MKFTLTALALVATTLAHPSPDLEERASVQVAHLTFHGGPASYRLNVRADGIEVPTRNALGINIIDAPDYNALSQCTFKTDGNKDLVLNIGDDGVQRIVVGPPQPIRSVRCQGVCIPTYGSCYGSNGQYIGPCCNGFCAATKCRPWNINHN